jgi:predicted nucleic acid-binding protein
VVLVDTHVLLDVVEDDPTWYEWSVRQLERASQTHALCINAVIYAELSTAFARIEELEQVLGQGELAVEPIPREALFLAGKAFATHRARGGAKSGVLADFFIGAHAAVERMPLLTRDVGRYRGYFPTVQLIAP